MTLNWSPEAYPDDESGQIAKLPTPPKNPINITMTALLGDDRQISFQTSYWPQPGENPNAMLDMAGDWISRQKARCGLAGLEAEIRKHEKAVAQSKIDMAELDKKHEEKIAALKAEHRDQDAKMDNAVNAARRAIEEEGRREWDAAGPQARKAREPYARRQVEIEAEVKKLEDERIIGHKNFEATIAHFSEPLKELHEKRAEWIALIG